MQADTIRALVRAQPFRPFRVKMNSAAAYEIRHPEMIRLGRDHFFYFYATQDDQDDRFEILSLLLVENVKPVDQPATSAG